MPTRPSDGNGAEQARDRGLVRGVGTWGLAASIVNGVVGAGIFSLPATMAAAAGDRAVLAYLACALAMAAVVLCFAEAASRVPTSGGPYGYVEAAFGPMWGFVAGVLVWLASVLACGGIAAALADGIADVAATANAGLVRPLVILAVFGLLGLVNVRGVSLAARFIAATTLVKLVPLALFVVVGGFALLSQRAPVAAGHLPARDFGTAVILALFAFCGMETPLGVSGEVARPERTIPRALFLSMGFVVLLYVAIQLVAGGLLGDALGGEATPLAAGIARVSRPLGPVLLVGAALSRLGWIASDLFGAPRVLFAFARDGILPAWLGRVSPRWATPHVAIWLHAAIAATLAITGTFERLAILSTLATAALYVLACLAAWRLQHRAVALFGTPLRLAGLPLAAVLGAASMTVVIGFGKPAEIAGLVAVMGGSALLFLARRLASGAGTATIGS